MLASKCGKQPAKSGSSSSERELGSRRRAERERRGRARGSEQGGQSDRRRGPVRPAGSLPPAGWLRRSRAAAADAQVTRPPLQFRSRVSTLQLLVFDSHACVGIGSPHPTPPARSRGRKEGARAAPAGLPAWVGKQSTRLLRSKTHAVAMASSGDLQAGIARGTTTPKVLCVWEATRDPPPPVK